MPGLVVTTGVRVGSTGTADVPSSSLFITGTAERGPTDDYRLIGSVSELETIYGTYDATATLYQHLKTFFEEGGTQAYVLRVTGPGASAIPTVNLLSDVSGTSVAVTPVGKGAWYGDLKVTTFAGVIAESMRVRVEYLNETVYLSGDLFSNTAIADTINANTPNYLTATAGAGAWPPVADTYTFVAGSSDNAGVDADDTLLVDALEFFVPELGAGAVVIPEKNGIEIWDGIQAHCIANNRIGLCAFPTPTETTAAADLIDVQALLLPASGDRPNGSYYGDSDVLKTEASVLAFYWPHVVVPDGNGGTWAISPETFAAAARCRAHVEVGPWRPGAGIISASRFATGLVFPVNSVVGGDANDARINALRVIDGTVRVYGARSVSGDEDNWRYITYRDVINYVVVQASARLEPYVFGVIDSRNAIFGSIASEMVNLLEPLRRNGGIYEGRDSKGNVTDRGYSVEVTDALNSAQQLAAGTVTAKIGLRVSSVSEVVNLIISKSGLTSAV